MFLEILKDKSYSFIVTVAYNIQGIAWWQKRCLAQRFFSLPQDAVTWAGDRVDASLLRRLLSALTTPSQHSFVTAAVTKT